MPTTPGWQAPVNGLLSNQNADNASPHVGELLGTHGITPIYKGGNLARPFGGCDLTWNTFGNSTDISQPFVMASGSTVVGRTTIPIMASGNGADLLVSLCPDNGTGAPNTNAPISTSLIPASWITNLSAPLGLPTAGPIASAKFNTLNGTGDITAEPWSGPTGDASGVAQNSSITVSGNYLITAGGFTTAPVSAVNTIPYQGGTTMGRGVPQPPIPIAADFGTLTTTSNSLIYAGGQTASIVLSNVWVASWDVNTGTVGSWSAQAPLPTPLIGASGATWNDTTYIIGGIIGSSSVSTVYYSTVLNGQLTAWNTGPVLPQALCLTIVGVVGNWLVVAGGSTSGVLAAPVQSTATYYSKIHPDGSLGPWQTGPAMGLAVSAYAPGWDVIVTDSAVVAVCGNTPGSTITNAIQVLSVAPTGLGERWYAFQWREFGVEMMAAFPTGNGQWFVVNTNIPTNEYFYTTLTPVPQISVPLPATGLTPGNTYHVILQQHQRTSADYLSYGITNETPVPIGPVALSSPRHGNSWTPVVGTGNWTLPITVHDNTPTGPVLHTWEDPSLGNSGATPNANLASRTSTLTYTDTGLLLGVLEATARPNLPLNSNPTFTSGVTGWTATNCTLAQSNAQTHGGLPFSGLITPNGTSATVFAESNLGPVRPNLSTLNAPFWYQAQGWVYSPTGYSSVSLSVNWYDSAGTYLSTSSNTVSVPATTWTFLNNYYVVPVGAAQGTLVPTESGTPTGSNLLYLSNVTLTLSPECAGVLSSVAQVNYPTGALWPPTGVTQLA